MNKAIAHIHLVGVCGVAMGSLAGMLKASGYRVTGSDDAVYPPMSDMLAGWGIALHKGYHPSHIGDADLVIIGNAISRGNPEAEHVLNARLPYLSMAQALHRFFLHDCEVIAVAGTHGKTTTTALLSHILTAAGLSPSFFIGGVSNNYQSNFALGTGRHFVIEGDEYDSAFFEKVPKFLFYRPHHCILTSLEFDHADIFSNIDEISTWFRRLVNLVPSNGNIIYDAGYSTLTDVVRGSLSRCKSYASADADFTYRYNGFYDGRADLDIQGPGLDSLHCTTALFGGFNYRNIVAAAAMALSLGVDRDAIGKGIETFTGVKRRQELIYSSEKIAIYEDFAHHPTAIRYTLDELRAIYPDARLWAVYEPRSATSRRNVFQDMLPASFQNADRIYIKEPYKLEGIVPAERIDIERVMARLHDSRKDAWLCKGADDIVEHILSTMDRSRNNVVVIMSNGGFDGIYGKFLSRLDRPGDGQAL